MTTTMPMPFARARELHQDERGAVMLIGLCMACFLIGSLWFLIGIGDAIVFRDSMQEVADHAVFTSAVLHAKGMNFISACNLIMLAFVFFHILLGIVQDVLLLLCGLVWVTSPVTCPLALKANRVYSTYGNRVMKPAVTALHYAELVAAYGYPWLGGIKDFTLGKDYEEMGGKKRGLNVLVLSPSMVPGAGLDAGINSLFKNHPNAQRTTTRGSNGAPAGNKKGLPVEGVANFEVCVKVAKQGVGLLDFVKSVPFIDKVFDLIKGAIASGVKFRYCNSLGFMGNASDLTRPRPDVQGNLDKAGESINRENGKIDQENANAPKDTPPKDNLETFDKNDANGKPKTLAQIDPGLDQWWGEEGPMYPWLASSNGSPWQEVWSMVVNPEFTDRQEHAVALGRRKIGQTSTADAAFGYFAESEFYFDCKLKWDEETCNYESNAAYSVQWRARLRRLEFPAIGSLVGGYIGNWIGGLASLDGLVKNLRLDLNSLPIGKLTKLVNPAIDGAFKKLKEGIQGAGTAVGGAADPGAIDGSYH